MATVKNNGKADKVIVFKYKSKVRYRRKNGHRQLFTRLNIDKILPAGAEEVQPAKKAAPKKVTAEKPAAEVPVEKAVAKETPVKKLTTKKTVATTKPAVKRTPRKKTEEKTNGA